MSNNDLMTQTEFAEFYGVSQPMVARYIKQGKIPESCIVLEGRYKKIKVQCAVNELERNLDPIKRKPRESDQMPAWLKEYDEFISFDPGNPDELGGALTLALDILSFLAASLDAQGSNRLERHLEDIAGQFGCERVNVYGLTGKRCVPVETKNI